MIGAAVKPEILEWARYRAALEPADLQHRFAKLAAWENGDAVPTLKQLERFARAVHVPIGFLFLGEPPVETIPIPDFRLGHGERRRPTPTSSIPSTCARGVRNGTGISPRIAGEPTRPFVGSLTLAVPIVEAAGEIRRTLAFDVDARRDCPTWTDALRMFITQAEAAGVLVMCTGVVYNNTHRSLDPSEFRGFAIADTLAPLVFINAADTKAAQMFTLAHELGHLWLGQSALTDTTPSTTPTGDVEASCKRVAAELLVPEAVLRRELRAGEAIDMLTKRLARRFKVSTLVILRRLRDIGTLSAGRFRVAYEAELERLLSIERGGGGDFYLSEGACVSKRFASALIESTLEGQTVYRDAMQMLGISKLETFTEFGRRLQFSI